MYSKRYLVLQALACRISYFFGSSHMLFDIEREILYFTLWGRIKSFISWTILMQYVTFFIPYQLVKTWKQGNFLEFNFIMVMWLCALLGCTFLTLFILWGEEICEMFNMYLVFVRNFRKHCVPDYDPNTAKVNKVMDHVLFLGMIFYGILACLFSMLYFIFPNSAAHMTSEIEDPRFLFVWVQCLYGFAVAWLGMGVCSLMALSMFPLLIYYYLIIPIQAKEFRVGTTVSGQKAFPILRTVEHLPSMYRCMEYMTNLQNNVLSPALIPYQTVVLYLVLFCNSMLIQHWDKLNNAAKLTFLAVSAAGMCIWGMALKTLALLSFWNKKTIASWKNHNWGRRHDKMYMKRFTKSCRPMCVGYGKYFLITPKSVLKFLRGVSRGTFRVLLLTMKKN